MVLRAPHASVRADRVVLATNAFRGLVPAIRARVVPVWDYVLMTEPLSPSQLDSIGWAGRQGLADAANQFHYYRRTIDDRILWGGYDAVYYRGNGIGVECEHRPETEHLLARQFFETFPQLEGLRFTHSWGGPIATTTRFTMTAGTALGGRLAYAVGYTGLGVGASRFGARVALDLVRRRTDRADPLALRAAQAAALPAGTAPLVRHQPDPPGHRLGRPPRRAPRPVAAHARPLRCRLRQLTGQTMIERADMNGPAIVRSPAQLHRGRRTRRRR